MKSMIMTLFTRTPLHVGAGSSVGAIDMPIQRERHTQIPIVPGSSLKGVLRDLWAKGDAEQIDLFGPESDRDSEARAGSLLVGEARVLCFPVRSARGAFAWLTCPLALQRYARDRNRSLEPVIVTDESCLAGEGVKVGDSVLLEEYRFAASPLPSAIVELLADTLPGEPLWTTLGQRLVVVADGIFAHFCANACEVQQRIRINDETGTVDGGGLFNQENVPAETVLYAVLSERKAGPLEALAMKLEEQGGVLQVGAHETIGLGFCTVSLGGAR